jgi:pimeloyl-ACP methyl ester carboxylesterase
VSPRVVLVHGLGRDQHDWDAVVPGLADLAECTAVDLAGFGAEGPPADGRYSPPAHAARMTDCVLTGPGPVHLVGNSLGGLVSVLAAARHPEKVAGLTPVAPALPLGGATAGGRQLALLGVPGVGAALMRAGRRQELERRTRQLLQLTFAVASLRMPVVALYGRHDRLVPVRHAVKLKRLLPAPDVRVLEHAGHLIQLEDPGDVVAAVRRQVTAESGVAASAGREEA